MNLDKMKAMMNQGNQEDKLKQNEELAKLRADTSIEKTILSKSIPNVKDLMPESSNTMPSVSIMTSGND